MFYTSYFSNLDKIKDSNLIPIAICGGIPASYNGLWYKKLAPSWSIWSEYDEKHDTELYTKRFTNEILSKRDPYTCYNDLINLADSSNICLLCYEEPNKFCHRHLVAKWFSEHGFPCDELK